MVLSRILVTEEEIVGCGFVKLYGFFDGDVIRHLV